MSDAQSDPILIWALAAAALGLFGYMVWPALDSRRWKLAMDFSPEGLIWGLLGVVVLAYYVPTQLIPAIIIAILVHEYGHVLAYRLAGHKAPVFRLAPFGGVAFSTERKRSQAESVFISLMGPGFSVVMIPICLVAAHLLTGVDQWTASYLVDTVWVVAFLNAMNLLPLYPLDGGQALRAVAASWGPNAARMAGLLMSAALAGLAIWLKIWLLLIFAVIGLAAAMRASEEDAHTTPMRPATAFLALGAHVALFATWVVALFPELLKLLG